VRWQLFDHVDQPTMDAGEATDVPRGSHAAVVPGPKDQFLIIY
jgi:hypothetical protein